VSPLHGARVLLVPGSTRAGSSNVAALRAAADAAPADVRVELFEGLQELPAFVPEEEPPPVVARFLRTVAAVDGVLFSTPEYAGGLPGSLKNLLDWTVAGGELYGKPVGWLDVANPGRGAGAQAQLLTVLGYVGADVVDAACVALTLTRTAQGPAVPDEERPRLTAALRALATRGRPGARPGG
jgi:NAD(P)H-dependent FMN reductase